jgi:hypothetical protein
MWLDLGFQHSPYAVTALPPSAEGERLLVGRDDELECLVRDLTYATSHPTIEGDYGVGKTSLVSVAAYRTKNAHVTGERTQLMLPLSRAFQLASDKSADEFRREVFMEVAAGFIAHEDVLTAAHLKVPDVKDVNRWLNSPLFHDGGAGISVLGTGLSGDRGTSPNEAGFSETGLMATVDRWLRDCFPSKLVGGFICVIDNLELLKTSHAARQALEALRDPVLGQIGLIWVLCGARGIVRTIASSPQLEGRLSAPIELSPMDSETAAEVVGRRIEVLATRADAYAPVEPDGFRYLYSVLKSNLRSALKHAEDYALEVSLLPSWPTTPEEKLLTLKKWLCGIADKYHADTTAVGKRAWEVFEDLLILDGQCSPGDYANFGFNSPMAMRPHIAALERSSLVESEFDETDQRRKTIVITPRGWLVQYRLNGYEPAI